MRFRNVSRVVRIMARTSRNQKREAEFTFLDPTQFAQRAERPRTQFS